MTLNTAIKSWQIQPATISGGHLVVSNSVSGTQILSYDANEDSFKWDYLATVTINEVPSGDIDGSNKEFTLSNTPLEDSERVYLNGLLQEPGSGKDYTIDGKKITFTTAPENGDVVLVSYLIAKTKNTVIGYAYAIGGGISPDISSITRFQFPFSSGTVVEVGALPSNRKAGSGCNSSIAGYIMGGEDGSSIRSDINKLEFPFDSGVAAHIGNLSKNRNHTTSCNSSLHGYSIGSYNSIYSKSSAIERIVFPFSGISNHVGNLRSSGNVGCAVNSSLFGYISGDDIDRFQFPFDSGMSQYVGELSLPRKNLAGHNSSLYGYIGGGTSTPLARIDRIQFPFTNGISEYVGNLSVSRGWLAGANSSQRGFFYGGANGGILYSVIDRILFPFDSGVAIHIGDLKYAKRKLMSVDTTDFVSMFI